jgi:hypothetical protein
MEEAYHLCVGRIKSLERVYFVNYDKLAKENKERQRFTAAIR